MMQRASIWMGIALMLFAALASPACAITSGTWTPLQNPVPGNYPDMGLLLTDGTVMLHNGCSSDWYRLTPDINGDYSKGTWTQIASMRVGYEPLYFAAQVLADGRVIVSGGEYDGCLGPPEESNQGALYDPQTNVWTDVPPPTGWRYIGNAASAVRADKIYQVGSCCTPDLALAKIKGTEVTWQVLHASQTGKNDTGTDETWTALPDQRLLTVDTTNCNKNPQSCTEIFDIHTNTWSDGELACGQLVLAGGSAPPAIGPSLLLPNGLVYQVGAALNGVDGGGINCLMDPATGQWHNAPPFPDRMSGTYVPAAVLPDGNVLIELDDYFMHAPSHFFEVAVKDVSNVTMKEVAAPAFASITNAFEARMLVLPTGQIMRIFIHDAGHKEVDLYTPKGHPKNAWRPVVSTVKTTLTRGSTDNKVSGTNFNGFTYGAAYGGGIQMSTNYPLVRITNTATGHVCYARTHDHNRMGIADGTASSTKFDLPAACEAGSSRLEVVANGIASKPVNVTLQ